MENKNQAAVIIRKPCPSDIQGVVELIRSCEPFLTAHASYIPWIYIRYWCDTCAVAVNPDGDIVGFCSMFPVPGGRFFLHQLAVSPKARRQGIATSLFLFLLERLPKRDAFMLEFTVDRRNSAVLNLNKKIAAHAGLQVVKQADAVHVVEESEEELYMMTPQIAAKSAA